jgi:alanine racemase
MVGRVCMDQFLVDVTDIPAAAEGDIATLIGTDGAETITATEVADLAETISWDILASLQPRLPRLYHRNGAVEAIAPPMW